jgi:hypothetical protein
LRRVVEEDNIIPLWRTIKYRRFIRRTVSSTPYKRILWKPCRTIIALEAGEIQRSRPASTDEIAWSNALIYDIG